MLLWYTSSATSSLHSTLARMTVTSSGLPPLENYTLFIFLKLSIKASMLYDIFGKTHSFSNKNYWEFFSLYKKRDGSNSKKKTR